MRSFDAVDAAFFLEWLAGPRNRLGLPESIRLCNQRIEERIPVKSFAVGLTDGPLHCGKSSVTQAAKKHLPQRPAPSDLPATCAERRCGNLIPYAKVVLFFDHFE